jgi:two-component system alkaline phosphatase synthesis response regulator PhoP
MAKKILIVDDDADFREIFRTKLIQNGFEVITADDGMAALEVMKKQKPDLTLLDVEMPKLNGAECLARIKADPELQKQKVVFLTNLGEPQKSAAWSDQKFAREAGAFDFIRKSDDLDVTLNHIIDLF